MGQGATKNTGNALDALDPAARENFVRASYVAVMHFLAQPDSRERLDAYKQKLIAAGRWPLEPVHSKARE